MLGKDVAVPSWLTPALTSLVGVVGGKVVGGAVGGDAGGGIGAIGCPLPGGWVSPRVSDFGVDRPHTDVRGWMTVVT